MSTKRLMKKVFKGWVAKDDDMGHAFGWENNEESDYNNDELLIYLPIWKYKRKENK